MAYEREGAQPAGLAVVQHIATVAALRVAMVRTERETLRREGAETLAELLQEVLDPETARRRLARHAIEGDTVLIVVRGATDEALLRCLQDHPHLLLSWGEDRYVLGSGELAVEIGGLPDVAAGMKPAVPAGRRAAGGAAGGALGGVEGRRVRAGPWSATAMTRRAAGCPTIRRC